MTKYQVQGPDGQIHEFEGPAGASPDQVMAVAQQQFGPAADHSQSQVPLSPSDQAFEAGRQSGGQESSAGAAAGQAAQQGTFGLSNYINAGARYIAQRMAGVKNADDYQTDLSYARGKSQGEIEEHPIAGTVGGVAGGIMGGGAIGAAAKGSRFVRAVAADTGSKVLNVGKALAVNAGIGAGTSAAEGQNGADIARNAAFSGVGGTVGQKVAGFALNKLQPAAARAMQTLADTIGETPATLQNAYNSFQQLTGRLPSMAELVGLKSQGKLRDLAKANPAISEAAIKAANLGNAPLSEQLQANATAPFPQNAGAMSELRDTEMDAAMDTPHPQTGVKLKDTPILPQHDPNGVLFTPHVEMALRPNTAVNARLQQPNATLDNILNGSATIADVDAVRRALRDQQNAFSRPAFGSPHARDIDTAKEFGDMANKVEGIGIKADPDYGVALQGFRQASRYADGFSHGIQGKSYNDAGGDDMLSAALKTAHGIAGYEHGNALFTAQQALDSISPSSVRQPTDAMGARHVAQAAAAATTGGMNTIVHGLRAIPVIGDRLPEKVQSVIAKQLFDPRTTQQGINNLTRAGVQAKDMRALSAAIGGVAGQHISDYLSQQQPK